MMDNMYIERFFRQPENESFFLFGPRGTGKSTWLKKEFPDALWLDLNDPENTRLFSAKPERLVHLYAAHKDKKKIVIDEIQRVPELLSVVHTLIEQDKARSFILTGSSARKLKKSGVDLLAGRALLKTMHPFMACELKNNFHLDEALRFGLIPLIIMSEQKIERQRTYAALYVKEEVMSEGLIRNSGNFSRFLEAISFSHAGILNVSNIARECQVERKVVHNYIAILMDLLLAFDIPVFTRRSRRAVSTHPKLYLFDAGVFQSLRPRGPFDRPEEIAGAALEGMVAQHLKAWIEYRNTGDTLYFWRTRSGNEVDFIVYGESGLYAIEVKNTDRIRKRDLQSLKALYEDYPESRRLFLYRGKEKLMIDSITCLPCEPFLLQLHPERELGELM
jgi:predicted AAA+ superfamily ATPase